MLTKRLPVDEAEPSATLHLVRLSTMALDLLRKQNELLLEECPAVAPQRRQRIAALAGEYDGLQVAFNDTLRVLPAAVR